MAKPSGISAIAVMILATGSLSAQPPRPTKAAAVDIRLDDLKAVFKQHFNGALDVNDRRQVSLAVNKWFAGNNRFEYTGFWNGEEGEDGDGNAAYTVVMIKHDAGLNIKLDDLKATFKKHFNATLNVQDYRSVSLAVNRWLTANRPGVEGFWNRDEGDDGHGNFSYRVAILKPDAAVDVRVEDLKATFRQHFKAAMDVNNYNHVGLAVNRWLTAHRRGDYTGLWNGEEGDDGRRNLVYSFHLFRYSADELFYVENSTKKVCQLTGDTDRGTGKPTLSRTGERYGVDATDLGSSFEHKGRLYFLFGDTGPEDRDVLAWTKSTAPGRINLQIPKGKDGKFLPLTVPGVSQGAFEIPSGGISIGGVMYVVFTTDFAARKTMSRSVLARSQDDGRTFKVLYDLSRTKFINVSLGLADGWLYVYGSGDYRKSDVFLARVRPADVGDRAKLRYFGGTAADGRRRWSPNEADAVPLFRHPQVGEFSVTYLDPIGRYVMLYNSLKPRGILLRSAPEPWGPWSPITVVFDPWRDKGYGRFMHISAKFAGQRDDLTEPKKENEWVGEYGPYVMARYTTGADGRCRIFYTMSTWNPYQVVVMRSDLEFKEPGK